MEKVGVAVVGALILIILIVGWANRGNRKDEGTNPDGRDTGAGLQLNKGDDGSEVSDDLFESLGATASGTKGGEELVATNGGDTPEGFGSGREIVNPDDINDEPGTKPLAGDREDPAPAPEPRPTLTRHKLKSGETISHLAQRYLGKASRWKYIVDANPGLDPARVPAGTEIVIPDRASIEATAGGPVSPSRPAKTGGAAAPAQRPSFLRSGYIDRYAQGADNTTSGDNAKASLTASQYRVKKGDTLGGIAQKLLGSAKKADAIYKANRNLMKSPDDLRVGWVLQIPGID